MKIIDVRPKHVILTAFFFLLTAYSLYQARFLILGPLVWIDAPQDGATVLGSTVTISGRAKNIAWMSLNDRQIFTDENGLWDEKLIVAQGLSIMTVKVRDRFGHETQRSVRVISN
ncbi:MAG: hypothetical protein EXS69_00965 [Candidatus Zambryskibacteria bacterium]|nr:hypothetical protein [Candidatus Zambryskibacteria bacterium]